MCQRGFANALIYEFLAQISNLRLDLAQTYQAESAFTKIASMASSVSERFSQTQRKSI